MESDRRRFVAGASRIVLGAVAVGPLLLSGCDEQKEDVVRVSDEDEVTASKAEIERGDAELLVQAARLEETAVKVYETAAGLPFIKSEAAILTTAARFMGQHKEHRDTLAKAAKAFGVPADLSKISLPQIPKDILDAAKPDAERRRAVLLFARKLEMQAAKAYYVYVVRKLRTEHARKIAADILPVETQHVAIYDFLIGASPPAPTPFFSEQS
jgi:rubrerythrin